MIAYLYPALVPVIWVLAARVAFPIFTRDSLMSGRNEAAAWSVFVGLLAGLAWPVVLPAALLWHLLVNTEVK